jgi:lysophospholipase L1-like esterase
MKTRRFLAMAAVSAALALCAFGAQSPIHAQGSRSEHWVGTWATAVVARLPGPQGAALGFGAGVTPQCFGQTPAQTSPASDSGLAPTPPAAGAGGRGQGGGRGGQPPVPLNFNNQTLRQIVHTSLGGDRLRVVLSNAFGTSPLAVGAAHVALREKDAAIIVKSDRVLTFGGSPLVNIPPGSSVVSDPVSLAVPPATDLAIDLYLPGDTATSTSPLTTHASALQTGYVSASGDTSGAADMPGATTMAAWFFLARVEVVAPEQAGAVVTFGDSITDGTRSTPNTNNRWPDQLAKRLHAQKINLAVLNQGIAGNRVLGDGAGVSALARFDRDVLAQSGVTHVIVLESINDIGLARDSACPTVRDLIAGQEQLIERAHARGLKIYGGTLLPFEGAAYYTPEGEAKRKAFNEWVRTNKGYDGVVDFDAVTRDPAAPSKLLPQYNSGDNLHLNDAGYQVMANAVDLALLKKK